VPGRQIPESAGRGARRMGRWGVTAELRPDELAGALAAMLPPGSTLDAVGGGADVTIVGVSPRPDDVLVRFRWLSYPYVLGFGLRTQSAYLPVGTAAEWAADARILLLEEVGTGLVARGTRVLRSDFIELGLPDWPHDRRYHVSGLASAASRSCFSLASHDGFDVATPRRRQREGSLLSWQRAFVNRAAGGSMAGHATVSRVDAVTGRLDECQVIGAPASVTLALCWSAVHHASWQGLRHIVTDLDDPVLDVLGFTPQGRSRVVDTTFLSMDHAAAQQVVTSSADWHPPQAS
jgi:hypothetical protein